MATETKASTGAYILGECIKAGRKAKGINQSTLAKMAGVSRSAMSRYENGDRIDIAIPILESIAKCLDLDLKYFYNNLVLNRDFADGEPFSSNDIAFVERLEKAIKNGKTSNPFLDKVAAIGVFLNDNGRNAAIAYMRYLTTLPEYSSAKDLYPNPVSPEDK